MNSIQYDITFYFGGLLNLTMKPRDYVRIVNNHLFIRFLAVLIQFINFIIL